MFKVTAYKNGQPVHIRTIHDNKPNPTLNTLEAIIQVTKEIQSKGIQYDVLVCTFMNINVDLNSLLTLFLTPCPPEIAALEAKHESFA